MSKFERNYKYVPLISAIFLIITFLTPTTGLSKYGDSNIYVWIWGLVVSRSPSGYNNTFVNTYLNNDFSLIMSVICFVILLIMAIQLLRLYSSINKGKIVDQSLIIIGIITIVTIIFYIISMDIRLYTKFWTYSGIGFGVIAPFISAVIAIIGAVANKHYSMIEDRKIIAEKNKFGKPVPLIKNTIPRENDVKIRIKFCPECKTEVDEENKFCNLCGYNLQNS